MKQVIIIGSSTCGPCKVSKALVEKYIEDKNPDLDFKYYNVDQGDISKPEADAIAGFDIQRVPVIVVDGVHIGGVDDIRKLISLQD